MKKTDYICSDAYDLLCDVGAEWYAHAMWVDANGGDDTHLVNVGDVFVDVLTDVEPVYNGEFVDAGSRPNFEVPYVQ